MRRIVSLVLAALVLVGVVAAIVLSRNGGPHNQVIVKGVIGSEKLSFFQDKDVQKEFAKQGLKVEVDTAGSRKIATTVDLSKYDFAFPAGIAAGQKIQADHKAAAIYQPFYSPMAIATFQPIVDILTQAGVVHKNGDAYLFDMKAYLDLVGKGKRWSDLPGASAYPSTKSVLITSTDVRTSNSAAMYLSISSYVLNGNNVVQNADEGNKLLSQVSPLFLRQGYTETSSDGPFEDYLSIGIGKTPMVMMYESQFLARKLANDAAIKPDMVLMYPDPTLLTKHTLVPLNDNGDKVGKLLTDNETLIKLEAQYGFRSSHNDVFTNYLREHNVPQPPTLVNLIDTPTYESLENMITGIERQFTTPPTSTEGDSQ